MNRGTELKAVLLTLALALTAGTAHAGYNPVLCKILVYRDKDYWTKPLTDWPATAQTPRSPRYVFDRQRPITIEVKIKVENYPATAEVEVCNTSLPGKPKVVIRCEVTPKDSEGFYVYRNKVSRFGLPNEDDEVLYLADRTEDRSPGSDLIQVIEEDVLSFKLVFPTNIGDRKLVDCKKDVMVDRGEWAACGITCFFGGSLTGDGAQIREEFGYERVNFWNVGFQEFPNDIGGAGAGNGMRVFVKNAGADTPVGREADWLYVSCHGNANGDLWDNQRPSQLILGPNAIQNAQDWNNDVDWVWIGACSWLNDNRGDQAGLGRSNWQHTLFGGPKPAHGLLGYCEPSPGGQWDIEDDFFDHAAADDPETIVTAFINANAGYIWGYYPYAILCHADNENDRLKEMTADTTSPNMKYWWFESDADNGSRTYTRGDSDPKTAAAEIDLGGLATQLKVKRVALPDLQDGAEFLKMSYECGRVVLSRKGVDLGRAKDKQAPGVSEVVLNEFISKKIKGLPKDAVLKRSGKMKVAGFNWHNQAETWDDQVVGQTFEFTHEYQGIPIEGDHISFIVMGDKVVQLKWNWHSMEKCGNIGEAKVRTAADALMAIQGNDAQNKPDGDFCATKLVYYAFRTGEENDEIGLAWQLSFRDKPCIYVDAIAGKVIDSVSDFRAASKVASSER